MRPVMTTITTVKVELGAEKPERERETMQRKRDCSRCGLRYLSSLFLFGFSFIFPFFFFFSSSSSLPSPVYNYPFREEEGSRRIVPSHSTIPRCGHLTTFSGRRYNPHTYLSTHCMVDYRPFSLSRSLSHCSSGLPLPSPHILPWSHTHRAKLTPHMHAMLVSPSSGGCMGTHAHTTRTHI